MTKHAAIKIFRQEVMPWIKKKFSKNDKPARREAWGVFTDTLCKNGEITMKQYETWTNIF